MPPRKTRNTAAPVPDDGEAVEGTVVQDTPPAPLARKRTAAVQRRTQSALADPKVRLPRAKRAVETDKGLTVAIAGRPFRISGSIGLMPLMEWAAAREELDATDNSALVGMFRILKDLVHPDEWNEFRKFTRDEKCTDQQFIDFQNAAMEAIAARPTEAPAAS